VQSGQVMPGFAASRIESQRVDQPGKNQGKARSNEYSS
ncbi:hypothetical protein BAV2606, partial [Bordetella avium 197N]